jgi:hypothetical protein
VSNNTTAMILHELYNGFDFTDEGEDYSLNGVTENDRQILAQAHGYWRAVNEARREADVVEWDGLLVEAVLHARKEADPNALTDRLLELAATAIAYASSVQRQTDAFNTEEEGE